MRVLMLCLATLLMAVTPAGAADHCAVGVYRFEDGGFIDVAPGAGDGLRWRLPDGRTGALTEQAGAGWTSTMGWTGRPDGTEITLDCAQGNLRFNGRMAARIALRVVETQFAVDGAMLAGRLLLPEGGDKVPLVVLVHGAERTAARQSYALQRMFPAAGIAAFVYDKRGTGASTGHYTHDFATLAADAVAAMAEARRLAGKRVTRAGYQAGSQGGWVAPLAARMEPVDFVIVSFGLAVSPAAAEHELLATDMARAGFGAAETKKALELSQAIETLIDSNFQSGYERIAELRSRYSPEPWFSKARGSVVAPVLAMDEAQLRQVGPGIAPGISLYYDPMPVLRNLTVPQLWVLAGDDAVAPPGETMRRLAYLTAAGRHVTSALYPGADHGLYLYETYASGERVSTRAPDGYFTMMRDFIQEGRIKGNYGATLAGPNP
ncbi:alpha/beta hydrolase family protein [Niveispirillum cyanobacteriorum]|nr:alpha/beta hydrolase [Niveispirillum cyanobacteriorum]